MKVVPFTFSHPAIVLPLTFIDKRRLSVTALAIGSITPDFEYFANFEQHSVYSHTWLGVFWFNLPVSVLLFFVYNKVVKNELIDNLPQFLKSRFWNFKNQERTRYSKEKYLIIFTSLLIGIISHLFWDKLLHRSVRLVEEPMDYYPVFWDGNSVIGAAVIAFITLKLPKMDVVKKDTFSFWFLTLLITLIVLIIRSAYSKETRDLEVSIISGLLIGLLMTSFFMKQINKETMRAKKSQQKIMVTAE